MSSLVAQNLTESNQTFPALYHVVHPKADSQGFQDYVSTIEFFIRYHIFIHCSISKCILQMFHYYGILACILACVLACVFFLYVLGTFLIGPMGSAPPDSSSSTKEKGSTNWVEMETLDLKV